jgi:DNA-binding CsgD family transcriptional regulator
MDPQRFDHLTQTLARRLGRGGDAEPGAPARRAGRPAPRAAPDAPPASGTCPYQHPTTLEPAGGRRSAARAICGWEAPPVPTGGAARPPRASGRAAPRRPAPPLSPREQEIAALIGQGLKNREIAAVLVLSERTVHAHVRHLLDKLGLASRAQIAAWATEHGALPPPASVAAWRRDRQ